jgi:hypothetical protein
MNIYIVIENGEAYPEAYKNYASAVKAVKEKHRTYLEERIQELHDLDMIEQTLADINVPEHPDGMTRLYIEKGINITIHRYNLDRD